MTAAAQRSSDPSQMARSSPARSKISKTVPV
jgi:hypothetical protein